MIPWRNNSTSYGAISLFLHWLMALLVVLMFILGWGREYAHGEVKSLMMDSHKTVGILILLLVSLRLSWRFFSPPPHLPEALSKHSKIGAHGAHALLYFMLFAMPFSGWLMLSAMGRPTMFLGIIPLPPLMEKAPSLVPNLQEFHEIMAYGLCGLIALHFIAAIVHHFVLRDDILARMIPFLKKKTGMS